MNATQLRALLERTLSNMPSHADELRTLDAALGDGDLGITVGSGATAVRKALDALEESADIRSVFQAAAKAFSTANPSTFAALVGGGLLAGAKTTAEKAELSRADAAELGEAVAARIADRGKTKLGDKTILDALIPSLVALREYERSAAGAEEVVDAMIASAVSGLEGTTGLQSAKGRAAWLQERSIGLVDPGATAYVRLLQELRANWSA